jgi:hypothetical protein
MPTNPRPSFDDFFGDWNTMQKQAQQRQYAEPGVAYPPWEAYPPPFSRSQYGVGPDWKPRVISCKVEREDTQLAS